MSFSKCFKCQLNFLLFVIYNLTEDVISFNLLRCSSWQLPQWACLSLSRVSSRLGSPTTTTRRRCQGARPAEAGVVRLHHEEGRDQLRCLAGGKPPHKLRSSNRSTSECKTINLIYLIFCLLDITRMVLTLTATKAQTALSNWRQGLQTAGFKASTATSTSTER